MRFCRALSSSLQVSSRELPLAFWFCQSALGLGLCRQHTQECLTIGAKSLKAGLAQRRAEHIFAVVGPEYQVSTSLAYVGKAFGDRNLRSAVLFALDVLAGDEEIRRHLAELALQEARVGPQDLLTWVLESLGKGSGPRSDECRKDRLLQFAACGFIGQIAFNDEKMQLKLIEAGALVLLLQSMRKHREDRDVQRAACLALRRLSPLRVQRLRSLGLQEVVSKAMDTHPGHAALQREAWKLLETLEQASRC